MWRQVIPAWFLASVAAQAIRNLFLPKTSAWSQCGFTDKFSALWVTAHSSIRYELKAFPSFPGEAKGPAGAPEHSCCKPLWSGTCWGTTTLCLGRKGLRRLWAPALGLPEQRHPNLCGFVCSYPTLSLLFQHCWRGLYTSCASQTQLPRVGASRLKASTALLWRYSKSLLQEVQLLLNTCGSTDTG